MTMLILARAIGLRVLARGAHRDENAASREYVPAIALNVLLFSVCLLFE